VPPHTSYHTVSELFEDGRKASKESCENFGVGEIEHLYGTMIEIPRACLTADKVAATAEFFPSWTSDLSLR
jgi:pyruvate, orthophosphate dikinase